MKVYVCQRETEADGIRVDRVFDNPDSAMEHMRREYEVHKVAYPDFCVEWMSGKGGVWGWWDSDRSFSYFVYEKVLETA